MFYSQFILAKKGPLGTIWIAAHLERKLRKNQVADTDIGVSVDSILFPDVPIALRLSSHLLLGVVRIYSRKVGYLFDDCSEALLKVKQAFRSTAVDLPPEESTAPYHSITLPETFDLDDFELPDNDIYQGNYVDHNVSSREQITLQDTMEGVVYTSSQFGLDERFGDGETSGLDLDEEFFLDKDAAAGHASILSNSDADPHTSVQPTAPLKLDDNHERMILNQIEGVDEDTDFIEDAHAPCTPGLVEEPNLCNIQETSACEDNLESEEHHLTEVAAKENLENASSELDHHQNKDLLDSSFTSDTHPDGVLCVEVEENVAANQDIKLLQEKACIPTDEVAISLVSELSDRIVASSENPGRENCIRNGVESEDHIILYNYGACEVCVELQEARLETNSTTTYQLASGGISENDQASRDLEISSTFNDMLGSNCQLHDRTEFENPQLQAQEPKDSDNIDHSVIEDIPSTDTPILHRCSSHLSEHSGADYSVQTELPSEIDVSGSPERAQKDEALHTSGGAAATTDGSQVLEENCITEPALFENLQTVCSKSNDPVENVAGDSQFEHLKRSTDSDLSAPEKLLSVPEGIADLPTAFLVESTPDQGLSIEGNGGEDGSKNISGKKRSFTESTLTMQSLYSVEYLGVVLSKRTAESVPDDDDLLSSILVGRRSSVLKVKPTPPPETRSMKRPRSAPRISASKRKVLMNEEMVLHGDTIRQQLINSEDIRRVRKKAPCTLPEISMIEKQFLEDQIFNQSIFTGLSMELVSLHNQTYDLREIRVSQHDANSTSSEAAQDVKTLFDDGNTSYVEGDYGNDLLSRPNDTMGTTGEVQRSEALTISENGEVQPLGTPLPNENQQEGHVLSLEISTETRVKPTSVEVPVMTPPHELLVEIAGIEIDGRYEASADAVNAAVESLKAGVVHLASLDITGVADVSLQTDAPVSSPSQKLDPLPSETDGPLMYTNIANIFANAIADKKDIDITAVEADSKMINGILLEENVAATSYDISKDILIEGSTHKSSSPPTFFPETGECSTRIINTNQEMEGIRDDKRGISNYDEVLDGEMECNSKNSIADGFYGLETSYPFNANGDGSSILLNNVEKHGWQEACALGVTYTEFFSIDRVDPDDFDYSAVGHDTEFLNVDDDEVAEADDSCVPNSEETSFLDNNGWSSRTRAVAKYLQTLFDKEAERGRNVPPMNNLLAGKTRKEASRMFFEALVLKTRDYIHVEQEKPFGNINMKPRGKLLKSDY